MQHTFTLAAWNFRLARRSLLALWGFLPPSRQRSSCGGPRSRGRPGWGWRPIITLQCRFFFAYLGFYLLTALEVGLATQQPPRRSGYTWATLPGTGQKLRPRPSRSPLPVVFAAWQLVVEFYPVTALEGWRRRQMYGSAARRQLV